MDNDGRNSNTNAVSDSNKSNNKNIYIILIIAVVAIVGVAAVFLIYKVPANKMVGTWSYDDGSSKIRISQDGLLYDDIFGRWGQCNYSLEGSVVEIIAIRGEESYVVSYPSENTMQWTNKKTQDIVEFTRISD